MEKRNNNTNIPSKHRMTWLMLKIQLNRIFVPSLSLRPINIFKLIIKLYDHVNFQLK